MTVDPKRASFGIHLSSPVCVVTAGVVHGTASLADVGPRRGGKRRRTVDTFCGTRGRRMGIETVDENGTVRGHISVLWPHSANLREYRLRCLTAEDCARIARGVETPHA